MEKAIFDFIGNPYHWIIGASFSVNWFLARGWFKSHLEAESRSRTIKDIDENLNSIKSELKAIQDNTNKSVSSIQKEHEDVVGKLNTQIEVLNAKVDDKHDFVIPSFKSHW